MIRTFRISVCTDIEVGAKDIGSKVAEKSLINKLKDIERSHYGKDRFEYCFKNQEDDVCGPICIFGGYYNTSPEGSRPTTLGINLEYKTIINDEDLEFFKKIFHYLLSIKWKLGDSDFTIGAVIENPNMKYTGKFRTHMNNVSVEYNSLKDKDIGFNIDDFAEYILSLSK